MGNVPASWHGVHHAFACAAHVHFITPFARKAIDCAALLGMEVDIRCNRDENKDDINDDSFLAHLSMNR